LRKKKGKSEAKDRFLKEQFRKRSLYTQKKKKAWRYFAGKREAPHSQMRRGNRLKEKKEKINREKERER